MNTKRLLASIAVATLSLSVVYPTDVFTPGFLKREFFPGITSRQAVYDGAAGTPQLSALPTFQAPEGIADNYAQRVSGFFIPPATGDYVFFINSDDDADLFLSTDDDPANKKLIAQEAGWSAARQWNLAGGAPSDPFEKRSDYFSVSEWPTPNVITLTGGERYYIEAVHHEGGGGDNLAVYIKGALDADPLDGDQPSTAGGTFGFFAAPATVTFPQQPQSVTVVEGKNAVLTVEAATTSVYGIASYQWKRNGTAIPGATSPSYTLPVQALADTGSRYTVEVSAAGAGAATSAEATVTVVPDTTPPVLLSAGSLKTFAGGTEVGLIFDEALSAASIATLANYSINNGATISAARSVTNSSGSDTLQDGVILTVAGVNPGSSYTVTVTGVADAKNNAITTAQTATFTATGFGWVSIGDTVNDVRNEALAVGTNGFNLVNGGNAFWTSDDDITMVYETVTGDFDKKTQVEWNDPSSNWARAGISARESLNNGAPTTDAFGENPASRYQMIVSDPETKVGGLPANGAYETNRRVDTGGATSARISSAVGVVDYPDSWVRLKRVGQRISMFYSFDGQNWNTLGTTDFGDETVSVEGPLPAQLFVGPTMGAENGNINEGQGQTPEMQGAFASRYRNYGNVAQKARGTQTYSIGLNFGAEEEGSQLSATDIAGADPVAQANWNNIFGFDVVGQGDIVADRAGASQTTPVTVDIIGSGNSWSSEGPRGENNNSLTGNEGILMTGYLDTGAATTTQVTLSNIPSDLTSAGYDVIVYALGGVGNKGGSYRVTDTAGTELAAYQAVNTLVNPTNYVRVGSLSSAPTNGNFIVFTNLRAASIVVEATTADGLGTGNNPRAPINAIQLVTPSGLASTGGGGGGGGTLEIAKNGASISITFEGTLQQADTIDGTFTDVAGASNPYTVPSPGSGARYYRARQ